jgi:hypothetical protein
VSTPVKPSDISKPVFAMSNVEFTIDVNTSTSCKKISLINATTNAIKKKKIKT